MASTYTMALLFSTTGAVTGGVIAGPTGALIGCILFMLIFERLL